MRDAYRLLDPFRTNVLVMLAYSTLTNLRQTVQTHQQPTFPSELTFVSLHNPYNTDLNHHSFVRQQSWLGEIKEPPVPTTSLWGGDAWVARKRTVRRRPLRPWHPTALSVAEVLSEVCNPESASFKIIEVDSSFTL